MSEPQLPSLIWHEYNIIQSVPCSLGLLKIINWTMYVLRDCWLMYWPTSRLNVNQYIGQFTQSTLDWHVGRQSVDSRPICWWYSVATVYRWIVGRYFADGSSTYHRHNSWYLGHNCQLRVGIISSNMWPVLDRYSLSVDSRPVLCQQIAHNQPIISQNQYA